jgi:hypothetical protein
MIKLKGLIILFISLAIVLGGCGKPIPGFKIHRKNNTLLVFLAMNNKSKIANTTIKNRELHVDITNGKKIEKRVTALDKAFKFPITEPDETLEIHGTNRINGYGVVHLTVSSPIPRKTTASFHWTGWQIKGLPKKQGPFANSGAFRVGNMITAYCYLPEAKKPKKKKPFFWINFDVEKTPRTVTAYNFEGNMIHIETYKANSNKLNKLIRRLSFPLDDLEPHETVEVEDKKKLGEDIHIAYLKVVPKKNEPTRVVPNRNRSFLRDR